MKNYVNLARFGREIVMSSCHYQIRIKPDSDHIHIYCSQHPNQKYGPCSMLKSLVGAVQRGKEGCIIRSMEEQGIENLAVELAKWINQKESDRHSPKTEGKEEEKMGKFAEKEEELRRLMKSIKEEEQKAKEGIMSAQAKHYKKSDLVKLLKDNGLFEGCSKLKLNELLAVCEDHNLLKGRIKPNQHVFFKGREVKKEIVVEVIETQRSHKEENMKSNEGVTILYEQVNGSLTQKIRGIEVYPQYIDVEDENGKETRVLNGILPTSEEIDIPIYSPLFDLVQKGELGIARMNTIYGPDRIMAVNLFVDWVTEVSKQKYGRPKVVMAAKPNEHQRIFYIGFKEQFDKLFSSNMYEKDASKLMGYLAPSVAVFKSSTKDVLKFLVADTKKVAKRTFYDGILFVKGQMFRQEYLSDKDILEGKKAKVEKKDAVQIRALTPTVVKGLLVFSTDATNDLIRSFGFNPEDYDGITTTDNLKVGGYNHGDILTIKVSDIRPINFHSKDAASSIGVQGTVLDPSEFRKVILEHNLPEKAKILKEAVNGNVSAVESVFGEVDPNKTLEDSDIALVKVLTQAIPQGNEWRTARYMSAFNVEIARYATYFREHVLKLKVSERSYYSIGCPIMTNVDNQWLDALSYFEELHYKETGELINFVVLHEDEIEHFNSKKYAHGYRNPVVAPASMQSIAMLPAKYARKLRAMGAKSIKISSCGRYGVHDIYECCMISQGFADAFYGDFDGDFLYMLLSDEAKFPVWRPEYPSGASSEKPAPPTSIEEYIKALKDRYEYAIKSAGDTGVADLTSRWIIEEWRRRGKELDDNIKNLMGWIREKTIQGIKHAGGKGGASSGIEMSIMDYLMDMFAPRGAMLSYRNAHESALKHPRLGFPVGKASAWRVLNEVGRHSSSIIKRDLGSNPVKIMDAFYPVFVELSGIELSPIETDSKYWKDIFAIIWKDISMGKTTYLPVHATNGLTVSQATVKKIIEFGNRVQKMYRSSAREYLRYDDQRRRKAFFDLKGWFASEMSNFVKGICGHHEEARLTVRVALTAYLGYTGFGLEYSERDNKNKSKPGYCFWYMGEETIIWLSYKAHPNNPFIHKLIARSSAKWLKV